MVTFRAGRRGQDFSLALAIGGCRSAVSGAGQGGGGWRDGDSQTPALQNG